MCVPLQPFFPNGQQMPFQNLSYGTPMMGNQWNEIGSQDTSGPYGWIQATQNSTPQNSWANIQNHQQTFSPSSSFNYMRTSNGFGTSKKVVCFLCEGKGHYANKCGSRKHMDVPFYGDSARPKRN
ncbi:hypothetical protein C2G38_2100805 [Gigaspora rosea]|uniref:CCHC-type domain-containing protein n=1 Tax=Gigaspora rosea TaxID=44941 RepID=A0A397UY74_9GLOM|nr:hypothetical protein C2G38_2100805 [Gigaspora rosea]